MKEGSFLVFTNAEDPSEEIDSVIDSAAEIDHRLDQLIQAHPRHTKNR